MHDGQALVPLRHVLLGALIAATVGLMGTDASLFGVAAWKVTLAAVGVVIFVMGGSSRRPG